MFFGSEACPHTLQLAVNQYVNAFIARSFVFQLPAMQFCLAETSGILQRILSIMCKV